MILDFKKMLKYLLVFIAIFSFSKISNAQTSVSISGLIKDKNNQEAIIFSNVLLLAEKDQKFVLGTVSDENGRFVLSKVAPGNYLLKVTSMGYVAYEQKVFVGSLSAFLDLKNIEMASDVALLNELTVSAKQDEVSNKMDKKVFSIGDNVSQTGGSVLQAMQNLPGVSVSDGKIQLRGNDKVVVLIDGKQTALTGFGGQSGLDNLPASNIEKIEIINNPSAKYDANGNAGIINIIYKKIDQNGFAGKVGLVGGLGALWERNPNLPDIRPQYKRTPKVNPSVLLNYRKNKVNVFLNADYLYTETLNKNEFVTRTYDDGTVIQQQTKRNRNTHFINVKTGLDWYISDKDKFTIAGVYGGEKILDHGDEPFFNADFTKRLRLWQFLEDELKTTAMAMADYQHSFAEPGRTLHLGANYTFHRENEKYFFDNILPTYTGKDAFKLLSDEQVLDLSLDYVQPLRYGKIETGLKFRQRGIPTNMQFFPGLNSPLDVSAGGYAKYSETIPAVYGNYVYENEKVEAELGLRLEYSKVDYVVGPGHPTYTSNGYSYAQPFPNMRLAYKINADQKLSLFFNRRVDRPNEVDIRVFPKYDDAEIIKVGNPALKPQFTNALELAYKLNLAKGYFYAAIFDRQTSGTITRIASTVPGSTLIYNIFQNAGKSQNVGAELVLNEQVSKVYTFNASLTIYQNIIRAFSVENLYPVKSIFTAAQDEIISGNVKFNNNFNLNNGVKMQLSAIYLAPDLIPQGRIAQRFSVDFGLKKAYKKGELSFNANDIFNTMIVKKNIQGQGFSYVSTDYNETQVFRLGYSWKL
jgi:outer membrane receptor protein involved in Fe transport